MAGIIDIHSHILPGIDDGAHSWKEALYMLKEAQDQGIRKVIATPHWGGPFGCTDPNWKKTQGNLRELIFLTAKNTEEGARFYIRILKNWILR